MTELPAKQICLSSIQSNVNTVLVDLAGTKSKILDDIRTLHFTFLIRASNVVES